MNTNKLEYLAAILPIGRENAVFKNELCKLLSLPDRETRLLIERLRRSGMVICSDERGYYRPSGIDELRAYCRRCRKRRRSDYQTNKGAEMLLKEWERNQEFDGMSLFKATGDDDK